jgi:hypothetical protein
VAVQFIFFILKKKLGSRAKSFPYHFVVCLIWNW